MSMQSTGDVSTQLRPLSVMLSALHLAPGLSALHQHSGIEVFLPKPATGSQVRYKAIVSECTSHSLLLKSFYDANVRGKVFSNVRYVLSPLATLGVSHCAFTTPFGRMKGEPLLNDKWAPQFNVDGMSHVPFMHQGHFFSPRFLICDHIFCREEYETQFVAVLGQDFLFDYFIRAQYTKTGWVIQLPPPCSFQISELLIFTDGCCLNNGSAAQDPEAKPVLGGYGIHFPSLPDGWDMYGALASDEPHTNQKAELTAVIRALQIVRLRNLPCANIKIYTDSKYAVQALNDWIPNLWRSNGYRTAKNRAVVNAELFRTLDEEVSRSIKGGVPVTLNHVPREQNKKADVLSKRGAASTVPTMKITNPHEGSNKEAGLEATGNPKKDAKKLGDLRAEGSDDNVNSPAIILGKNLIDDAKPLVRWNPDGVYWVEWRSKGGSGGSLTPMYIV